MKMTGSQIIIECLKEQGVDTIFGYPGGTILNVYDELYRHPEIRHILTSHEQGAAHAADGYARATGKVGVCFATSGPGATNLVTGIATAYMDSIPVVAITANVAKPLLGKDSFQEIDIAGVAMPITKHSMIVKEIGELSEALRRAFEIAKSGRPGPVLIDVTKDVTAAKTEFVPAKKRKVARVTDTIETSSLEHAAHMINRAKRPYLFVGGGAVISRAEQEVRALAHKIGAPVCDTLMGKGTFDGTDPLYTGMLGMHGTKASNLGVSRCDLLITIGARFSDRVTGNASKFARKARILQIDVDAAEINKNVLVDESVIGDAKEILTRLLPLIKEQAHEEWNREIAGLKDEYPLSYDHSRLTGPGVIEEIYKVTGGDALIVTEVGQNQMWAAQYYKFKEPGQLITSGGLGTMGYGLGAAMGAKCGRPEKTVINVAGDGCFRMNMNEIATLARHHIPVIEVILNNHVLGMVRQWQTLFYDGRYSNTVLNDSVDFVKVAEALGAAGIRVTKKEEIGEALKNAIAFGGPVVIECLIDSDDKVFPMVPAGAPIDEVFDEEDLRSE